MSRQNCALFRAEMLEVRRLLAAIAPDIHDQQTIYSENLENGLDGWTIDNLGIDRKAGTSDDGLWHLTTRRGTDPGHSGTHSFYYGIDSKNDYDTGFDTSGSVRSPEITLPALADNEKLEFTFKYFSDIPTLTDPLPDALTAITFGVVTNQKSTLLGDNYPTYPQIVSESGGWITGSADLTPFAGQTIQLNFAVDTSDLPEHHEGLYLDDFAISRTPALWTVDDNQLVQVDPNTGSALRSIDLPSDELPSYPYLAGLASDGDDLFYTATTEGGPSQDILEIDSATGNVVKDIPAYTSVNGITSSVTALAYDPSNNSLYAVGFTLSDDGSVAGSDALIRYDLTSGKYVSATYLKISALTSQYQPVLSATYDPTSGHLFLGFENFPTDGIIAEVAPSDTAPQVIRTFVAPSDFPTGIVFSQGEMFVSNSPTGQVAEVDPINGQLSRDFLSTNGYASALTVSSTDFQHNDVPAYASDLGNAPYDLQNLTITPGDSDWFKINPAAGTTVSVSAVLGGTGSISNADALTLAVWKDPFNDAGPLQTATLNSKTRTLTVSGVAGGAPLYVHVAGAVSSSQNTYLLTIKAADADEPNDTSTTSTNLGVLATTVESGLTAYPGDEDWYKFQMLNDAGTMDATVSLVDGTGSNASRSNPILNVTLWTDTNGDAKADKLLETASLQGSDLVLGEEPAAANQRFWLQVAGVGAADYTFTIRHHDAYDDGQSIAGLETEDMGPVDVSSDPDFTDVEMQVAVDPTNPNHLVIASSASYTDAEGDNRAYMNEFRSFNDGQTWDEVSLATRPFALGDSAAPANDAVVAFDRFGNLYITFHYEASDSPTTDPSYNVLARSTDGGSTFTYYTFAQTTALDSAHNRVQIVLGPDAQNPGQDDVYLAATGVRYVGDTLYDTVDFWSSPAATAKGALPIKLGTAVAINNPSNTTTDVKQFPSLAVGLQGQVYVSWWDTVDGNGGSIRFAVDPDGLGTKPFGAEQIVTTTLLGYPILVPWQPTRGIAPVPFIAIDRSNSASRGRVYIAYTDYPSTAYEASQETAVFMVETDDPSNPAGATWTAPQQITNDYENPGYNSDQFPPDLTTTTSFANIAVDPVTGMVAYAYYVTDTDTTSDQGVQEYVTIFNADGSGGDFYQLSSGLSYASGNPTGADFLLYNGVAIYDGTVYAAWADDTANPHDLEAYFNKINQNSATDLAKVPGANADGTVSNISLSGLTVNPGDDELYNFTTDDADGKLVLDITLADRNHNGKLDPDEMLGVVVTGTYGGLNSILGSPESLDTEQYTTTPDSNGNFHYLATLYFPAGQTGPQQYTLEVYSLPDGSDNRTVEAYNSFDISLKIPQPALVYGNVDGIASADSIVLERDAKNKNLLDYYLNDPGRTKPYQQIDLRTVQDIFVNGNWNLVDTAADSVTLDFTNGPFQASGYAMPRLFVYGGTAGSGLDAVDEKVYIEGPSNTATFNWDMANETTGSYEDLVFPSFGNTDQRVNFIQLSYLDTQFIDQTAGSLTVNMVDRGGQDGGFSPNVYIVDDSLDVNLTASPLAGYGRINGDPYNFNSYVDANNEEVEQRYEDPGMNYDFDDKTSVVVNAGDNPATSLVTLEEPGTGTVYPAQTNFNINWPSAPASMKSLNLSGGTLTTDSVTVYGSASTVRLDTATGILYGVEGGGAPVTLVNLPQINLTSASSKSLEIDNAASYAYTPSTDGAFTNSIAADAYTVSYAGYAPTAAILLKGATDSALTVNGTGGSDLITVGNNSVQLSGHVLLTTSGITTLNLSDAGSNFTVDVFNIALGQTGSLTNIDTQLTGLLHTVELGLSVPAGSNTVNLSSNSATLGKYVVNFANVASVHLTGNGATTAVLNGTVGTPEAFTIAASATTGSETATITANPDSSPSSVSFSLVGVKDLLAEGTTGDGDTLVFEGTSGADKAIVNFAAAGTASSPALQLQNSAGSLLLMLETATGFSSLALDTLAGNDQILINTAATSSARSLSIDGGTGSDTLVVSYGGSPVIKSTNGSIALKFGSIQQLIQYINVETVSVKKTS